LTDDSLINIYKPGICYLLLCARVCGLGFVFFWTQCTQMRQKEIQKKILSVIKTNHPHEKKNKRCQGFSQY